MIKWKSAARGRWLGAALFAVAGLVTMFGGEAFACACGCGVFEVGAGAMRPEGKGGVVFIEDDVMTQDRNRHGASKAPAENNEDKEIRSNFVNFGAAYSFDRAWTIEVEAPVWTRRFKTEDEDTGEVGAFEHTALGDVRVMGVYTGFSPDQSTGVQFGVKLPTGDWKYAHFDRDTQIGTGSTDILLGAYRQGSLCKSGKLGYFVQGLWDAPVASQGGYRPGQEFDAALGVYVNGASLAGGKVRVAPVVQLVVSVRGRDHGANADPENSGHERILLAPGLEFDADDWKLYGDVEVPIYERVNGDQLVARRMFKIMLSRAF